MANPFDKFDKHLPAGATNAQQQEEKPPAETQPERSPGGQFLHGLGLGTRDVIEGAAALPGMALDAATWPGRAIIRAAGGSATAPTDIVSQGLTAAGLPEAETPGERLSSGVIRGTSGALAGAATGFLPSIAANAPYLANVLSSNIPTQVAAGAASGGAGEVTRQAGYGPWAQQGASLIAGLGTAGLAQAIKAGWSGANALLAPFTQAGREEIARNALLQGSAAPQTLLERLQQGAGNPRLPGSPVTTAQQARDPGLLAVELGQRSDVVGAPGSVSPAAQFRNVDAQRNVVRQGALETMADASDPGARGATVRTALEEGENAMGANVSRLFEEATPADGGAFPIDNIQRAAARATAPFSHEQMGGGVPAELQAVIDDIVAAPEGVMTFAQVQNVRSRLGQIAGLATREGNNRLASAAGNITRALEGEVDSPAWQAAIAARREMGAALDRATTGASATGQILKTDRFGRPIMPDENVADRAISSVGNLRQTLGAVDRAIVDGRAANLPAEQIAALEAHAAATREALRGQFIANLTRRTTTTGQLADAAGNVSDVLSPAGFRRFMQANGDVAAELFDPRQLANLRLIAADFAESSMAQATGKTLGSPTAQNLSVGNLISRVSRGLIDPSNPLAQTALGVGPVMKWIYSAPEQATRQILTEAMVNPQFAQALLARGTPETMRRAMGYVERTMGERLRASAAEATARQGVRTIESEGNQQTRRYNFDVQGTAPQNRLAVPP